MKFVPMSMLLLRGFGSPVSAIIISCLPFANSFSLKLSLSSSLMVHFVVFDDIVPPLWPHCTQVFDIVFVTEFLLLCLSFFTEHIFHSLRPSDPDIDIFSTFIYAGSYRNSHENRRYRAYLLVV